MHHDFDRVLDRRGTHSLKWDYCGRTFGLDDVIPMWVADMDFEAPPAVVEAIRVARRAWRVRVPVHARLVLAVGGRLAGRAARLGRQRDGWRDHRASSRR